MCVGGGVDQRLVPGKSLIKMAQRATERKPHREPFHWASDT